MLSGTAHHLQVDTRAFTIEDLKGLLATPLGIPDEEQDIILEGKILENEQYCCSCGLAPGNATIHVVRRQRPTLSRDLSLVPKPSSHDDCVWYNEQHPMTAVYHTFAGHALFVGGRDAAGDLELLRAHGIATRVIVAADMHLPTLPTFVGVRGIVTTIRVPLIRVPFFRLSSTTRERNCVIRLADVITDALEHGSVLVASEMGAHRAPLAAFCGLAALTDASAAEICEHLHAVRKIVEFEDAMLEAINTWITDIVRARAWRPSSRLPLQSVGEPADV